MEDDSGGVDDGMESGHRPCGEGGFGLGEDQVYRWQPSFGIKFEARADFIQCLAKRIQCQWATKMRDHPRGGFGLKKSFDGGEVTKYGHHGKRAEGDWLSRGCE